MYVKSKINIIKKNSKQKRRKKKVVTTQQIIKKCVYLECTTLTAISGQPEWERERGSDKRGMIMHKHFIHTHNTFS